MNIFMILFFSTLVSIPAIGREETDGIRNFHQVHERLYRGGRPNKEGVVKLKEIGVKTIVDLECELFEKEPTAVKTERTLAADLGIRFEHIPMHPISAPKKDDVERALSIITDPANQPVYVHCNRGSDRTGIVVAAYRIRYDGWTVQKSVEEMKQYGHRSIILFWWKNLLHSF